MADRGMLADCRDHSCVLRDRSQPGGMRTNGGCQHMKLSPPEMQRCIREMGHEIARLRDALGAALTGWECALDDWAYEVSAEEGCYPPEIAKLRALLPGGDRG